MVGRDTAGDVSRSTHDASSAHAAVGAVADALTSVARTSRLLDHPRVSVVPEETAGLSGAADRDAFAALVGRVGDAVGFAPVDVVPSAAELDAVGLALSLRFDLWRWSGVVGEAAALPAVELAATARAGAHRPWTESVIRGRDGALLPCYSIGDPAAAPVVVVGACGMPAGLVGGWLRGLSASCRVVTWESRGLFGTDEEFGEEFDDAAAGMAAQVDDLEAVLAAFELDDVHLLGLCGGAPIALAAAHSSRVGSFSLWHGDWSLGDAAPRTTHQEDMHRLMLLAGTDRGQAQALQELVMTERTVRLLPDETAHQLVHPYATAEQMYRYGLLNGSIMSTDCRPLLEGLEKPCLVVSSEEDATAHPEGSDFVAGHLGGARLVMLESGDHLTAFGAGAALLELALGFITEHTSDRGLTRTEEDV